MSKTYTINERARQAACWFASRNAMRAAASVDRCTKLRATRMATLFTLLALRIRVSASW